MTETDIPEILGAKLLKIDRYADNRGYFEEVYSSVRYDANMPHVSQTNVSVSKTNVLRGLHVVNFRKLVTCLRGKLYDVIADVREGSPTYGNTYGTWLTAENHNQVLIPAGCAHGFFSAEDDTILMYAQDGLYDPSTDRSIRYDDPTLNIQWPLPVARVGQDGTLVEAVYLMSGKDREAPLLGE